MARPRFRLATLLRLREAARDERRAALAEAYRVDDVLARRAEELDQELARLRARMRRVAGPGKVDVDELLEAQRYELSLRAGRQRLDEQRGSVAEEIERRRELLGEANREVRVLEKLREKQARRYRDEQARREIKLLDETAQRRAALEETP